MYSEKKAFHSCQLRLSIRTYRPKHFALHTLPKKKIWFEISQLAFSENKYFISRIENKIKAHVRREWEKGEKEKKVPQVFETICI